MKVVSRLIMLGFMGACIGIGSWSLQAQEPASSTVRIMPPFPRPQPAVIRPEAKETGTYLGLWTSAANPSLRKQLKLPRGTALVVDRVERGSPAERDGLKQYDVLTKFEDQILINPQQLAMLVRMKNPQDRVELTLIRDGEETTSTVTLATAKLFTIEDEFAFQAARMNAPIILEGGQSYEPSVTGEMINTSEVTFTDETYEVTLTIDGASYPNKRYVKAKELSTGKIVFNGPINTDQERAMIPAPIIDRLKKMNAL